MGLFRDLWQSFRGWAKARAQAAANRELHEDNRAKALLKAKELIENTPIVPEPPRQYADATKIRQFCESTDISPQTKRQVLEAMPLQPDWVTPWQDWLSSLQFDGTYWPVITGLTGRKEGSAFPFFRSEGELMILRDMSRALCKVNNHAAGMIAAFRSYVIRQGYACTITDKDGKDPKLQTQVQAFVDAYYRKNAIKERQKEGFDRSVRDGEVFLRNFPNPDGDRVPTVRFIWSEQVKQPVPEDRNYWYGVLTAENDIETILEYAVHDLDGTVNYERVSPKDVVHIKRNVDSGVKRGIPDFCWGLHDAIRQAGKLEGNLGEGSAIQAAIAYILQYAAGTKSEIEAASTNQSDYSAGRPWQQNSVRDVQQFEPGTIVHTSKNEQFLPGPANSAVAGHLEVVTMLLRSAAVRWNAPEWLVSADSTSSNYASSLVAESPFVLRIEDEQTKYVEAYTRLVTRAIEMGIEAGVLPSDTLQRIEVKLEAPSAVVRDKLAEAQTDTQRLQQKTKSPQQSIREQGFKPEEIAKEWKEWEQLLPSAPAAGTPEQPGQEGKEQEQEQSGGLLATALGKGEEDRATPNPPKSVPESVDASGHAHKGKGEGGGQFTKVDGGGSKAPKHGERAAALHAKRQELRQARIDTFNELKADAEAAKEKADEHWGEINDHVDNMEWIAGKTPKEPEEPETIFHSEPERDQYDSDKEYANDLKDWQAESAAHAEWEVKHNAWELEVAHSDAFRDLESAKDSEPETAAEHFQLFKDVEAAAKTALEANKAINPDESEEFLADQLAENDKRLKATIAACKAGRERLRAYADHRREMKAIRDGEPMDVRESFMVMPDDSEDLSCLIENFTGTITDAAGRKRHYQDGKPVAEPKDKSTPTDGEGSQEQPSQSGGASAHTDDRMKSLIGRIAEVPQQVVQKVGNFVQKRFESLSVKYGKTGARLIIAGMIALSPTPIPGSSLIPIALASVVKRLFGNRPKAATESMETESLPSGDELVAAIKEALAELYADVGEKAPEIDDADAKAFIDEYQRHIGESCEEWRGGSLIEASFDESSHPRDDHGRFVGHEELEQAKIDPAKAEQLRAHVTNPEERRKLDAALVNRGHFETIESWTRHEQNVNVHPAKLARITSTLQGTASRMPPKCLDAAMANMSGPAKFYNSVAHLTAEYNAESIKRGKKPLRDGLLIAGTFELFPEGNGFLHLDHSKTGDEADAIGTYAHEFFHAADGADTYSGDAEWQAAYKAEIQRPLSWPKDQHPLSQYASTHSAEGFAEFGRIVVQDAKTAKEFFPLCWAFLENKGLV